MVLLSIYLFPTIILLVLLFLLVISQLFLLKLDFCLQQIYFQ